MFFWQRHARPAYAEVHADEVRRRLAAGEKLTLIDVREPHEFARGHIPGARLIPLGQLQARLGELDPSLETIVVCRSGHRSGIACHILSAHGFKNVSNLAGGMLAWRGPVA